VKFVEKRYGESPKKLNILKVVNIFVVKHIRLFGEINCFQEKNIGTGKMERI